MTAPNFANRTLYHGDNLPFLRGLNSESVHLIATDPPFNKGRDFHATPDSLARGARFQDRWSWDDDVEGEWVDKLTDDWPAVHAVIEASRTTYGEDMAAFLCFMAVRLIEMHRILKPTGSLYLHIDHTAHAWVKCLMDGIFGKRNFMNEIVWCYKSGGVSKRYFAKKHDTILFYAKDAKLSTFNVLRVKSYGQPGGGQGGAVKYFKDKNGVYSVVAARDWWEISMLSTTHPERTGYPTQKPLALYERIINASSNPGDVVLDPFAGCATTPIAAERLGRQWVGMDIWDGALDVVKQRLEDNRQLLNDIPDVHYRTDPPTRTDDGLEAAPFIQVTERYREPAGPRMTRQEMYEYLLAQHRQRCQGCDRTFEDPRYLELDHNTPRSDGGLNHITNRVLLCSPCNRAKSNVYTLSGLRRLNTRNGWMA